MSSMIPPTEKHCPRCKKVKPASDYREDGRRYDGLASYCKLCTYDQRRPREIFPEGHKRCTYCREIQSLDQFFHDKGTRDGHGYECKSCHKDRFNRVIETFEPSESHQKGPRHRPAKEVLPDGYKRCRRCDEVKPTSSFYARSTKINRDGLYSYCKSCHHLQPQRTINIPEQKRCTRCGEIKPATDFYLRDTDTQKKLSSQCNMCSRVTATQYRHMQTPAYKTLKNQWRKLRQYGITIEEYEAMFTEQDGKCAICKQPETAVMHGKRLLLAVDHCHTTDAVRGLLCANCNRALGLMKDDPERVEAMLNYIRERVLY